MKWRRRVVVLLAAGLAVVLLSPRAGRRAQGERPDVFIFLVDALRADHVGCYGYGRPTTPNLDAFAQEALLFEQAQAACSWTRPSVASIFTGLYPRVHGTRKNTHSLAKWVVPVTELFAGAGYATAVISANANITVHTGFDRGLDEFVCVNGAPVETLNAQAQLWLRSVPPDKPVFLYVHAMEPHLPYAPSPEAFALFDTGAESEFDGSPESLCDVPTIDPDLSAEDLRHLLDLYDGEVRDADAGFADFLAMLGEMERDERALIVFVADHGEAFGEHGTIRHGHILSQEVLRVPLLIRFPDGWSTGNRVAQAVSLVDVLPTVTAAAGISLTGLPYQVHGCDLRGDPKRRCIFADVYSPKVDTDLGAVIDSDGFRYVMPLHGPVPVQLAEATGLWDTGSDPREERNLADARPDQVARCEHLLSSWISSEEAREPATVQMTDELRRDLADLGYL